MKMNRQREENMDIQKVLNERVKEVMHKVRKEVAIPQGWDLIHQGIKMGYNGWSLKLALQSINDPESITVIGFIEL